MAIAAERLGAQPCAPDTLLQTLENPAPGVDDFLGRDVAISGNLVVAGAHRHDPGGVIDAGIAYVFDASTGTTVSILNNPAPALNDYFGYAVAISGNLAVVGAYRDDPGGVNDQGAAYVFNATTGALVATLDHPAVDTLDQFGYSVAIDGNVAVVGAWRTFASFSGCGAAYTFNATTGAPLAALANPTPALDDEFGNAVAVEGNLAVVGAYRNDWGPYTGVGEVYLFDATTGALVRTVPDPEPQDSNYFGTAVAIDGNLLLVAGGGVAHVIDAATGALISTLVTYTTGGLGGSVGIAGELAIVGAYGANPGGASLAGLAFVFDATSGILRTTLAKPVPAPGDQHGIGVAIDGNIAVVGCHQDDPGGVSNAGSARTYSCTAGTPTPTPTPPPTPGPICTPEVFHRVLSNPLPAGGDYFGHASAVSGNLAVVGSYYENTGGMNRPGQAYVYDVTDGSLVSTLLNPTCWDYDEFGVSVAISGYVAVVGAPGDNVGGTAFDAGAAYVYDAISGELNLTLNNPAPLAGDGFGISVGISGNLAVVGAQYDNPGGVNNAGSAYVFDVTTGALVATLNNPTPAADDYFGNAVAISGNVAVVGAYYDNSGSIINLGRAYAFNATTGAQLSSMGTPSGGTDTRFAKSVAISGTYVVVGSWQEGSGGRAYVFDAASGTNIRSINNPNPAFAAYFGYSVGISGEVAVIGTPFDDVAGDDIGAAYLYNVYTGAYLGKLNTPSPGPLEEFGDSVAIDGNVVVIGASRDNYGGGLGTGYVFGCPLNAAGEWTDYE